MISEASCSITLWMQKPHKIPKDQVDRRPLSSSKFQVTPTGDVSGSQVLFTGGTIGGFTLSTTEISSSGLLLKSNGQISGANVLFNGG